GSGIGGGVSVVVLSRVILAEPGAPRAVKLIKEWGPTSP
ncbi:unnamed protein product, partial [marine sediment metagenome]